MKWHDAPVVTSAIVLVLALHVAVRYVMGPALGVDDAEQALFAQAWSLNYRQSHPPLYTWLVVGLGETVGLSLTTFVLLRAVVLGLTWLLLFALARRVLEDPRLAALATASYALIYKFAFEAQTDLTHALLGATLIIASLLAFGRLARQPSSGNHLLLGLVFGLSLIAKWNSAIFIVALFAASMFRTELRQLVLSRRFLLVPLMTALVAGPSAIWIALNWQRERVAEMVYADQGGSTFDLVSTAIGLGELVTSVLVFPQPFLIVFVLVFGSILLRRSPRVGGLDAGLLLLVSALALVPFALMAPLAGVTQFPERWLLVALMPLPIALFGFIDPARLAWRPRAFLAIALVAVVGALGARAWMGLFEGQSCKRCRTQIDFAAIAEDLGAAGFSRGTVIVEPYRFHLGGNLRLAFPDSRFIEPSYPLSVFPAPIGSGQCLIVMQADHPDLAALETRLVRYAQRELGAPADADWIQGTAYGPIQGSDRRFAVRYSLLREGAGACR